MTDRQPLTVGQVTRLVKGALERSLSPLWVLGEISNLKVPASGHAYFTLKDAESQITAVAFRRTVAQARFQLQDGMQVVVHGTVSVYEPRGQYQLVVDRMEPHGTGALELAFRQLKEKLEREGLFDPARKKRLPFLPSLIALVTSPNGAAVQDMLRVIQGRFPPAEVLVVPVRVQGEGAAAEIAAAVDRLNREDLGVEVMIVGRGGGSLEDLWAFNEEVLARAIAASRIPVISAVGHEVDVSISDLVADRRALTPTAAGEMAVPDLADLLERLRTLQGALGRSARSRFSLSRMRLDALREAYGFRRLSDRVRERAQRLDDAREGMDRAASDRVREARDRLKLLSSRLEDLSPMKVLGRGYAILTLPGGAVVREPAQAPGGARLKARLAKGTIDLCVEGGAPSAPGKRRGGTGRTPPAPGLFD